MHRPNEGFNQIDLYGKDTMPLKRVCAFGFVFIFGIAIGSLTVSSVYAQRRVGKTQILLTQDLAGFCDGKEVVVELFEAGPGSSGKHHHPGHSFSWAIEGTEIEKVEGKPPRTVNVGELVHEGPMEIHDNENKMPVRKLTFRILEKGKSCSTQVE
jgi:hypothetical protein